MRVRLKADGRVVEIRNGDEWPLVPEMEAEAGITDPGSAEIVVRALRDRLGLTQAELAMRLGLPVDTIRNWEQGKRAPRGPARALLLLLSRAPEWTLAALARP